MHRVPYVLKDLWDGFSTRKSRTALSFFATAVGIASLVVLLAILGGIETRSRLIMRDLGANVAALVQQPEDEQHLGPVLDETHAYLLARNLPQCLVSTVKTRQISTLGTDQSVTVVATDSSLVDIRQWPLQQGRFLDRRDCAGKQRHAVVSAELSRQWNWQVGDLIMLRDLPFKVVGVVHTGGSGLETEWAASGLLLGERAVFVPNTVHGVIAGDAETVRPGVDAVFVKAPSKERFARTLATAGRVLTDPKHRLAGVSWVTAGTLLRGLTRLEHTIRWALGSIAFLCLVLGGTTLASLMVAGVAERVTEIGVRRALGATPWDIASLFVLEGCVLTGASSLTAAFVTIGVLQFMRSKVSVPLELGLESVLIPVAVAFVLGAIFSYGPALGAARIEPSEALRND